jgi:hypothetical protein
VRCTRNETNDSTFCFLYYSIALAPALLAAPVPVAITPTDQSSQSQSNVQPIVSDETMQTIRAAFAACVWHCGALHDAITLAGALKFQQITRPGHFVSAFEELMSSFMQPSVELEALGSGTSVVARYLDPTTNTEVFSRGEVEYIERAVVASPVKIGMRLEAKDRKNPGLVCMYS